LYLSAYFMARRGEYYERLQAAHDGDDWEGWLRFFLQGVYETSEDAAKTAGKIMAMRDKHRDLVVERFGRAAGNGLRALALLYKAETPVITAAAIKEELAVSFVAANGILARLEGLGLLRKINEDKRNRVFVYGPYLDLFEAPAEGGGA
jgi:Fic family protein